jgi:hypothetical protein
VPSATYAVKISKSRLSFFYLCIRGKEKLQSQRLRFYPNVFILFINHPAFYPLRTLWLKILNQDYPFFICAFVAKKAAITKVKILSKRLDPIY